MGFLFLFRRWRYIKKGLHKKALKLKIMLVAGSILLVPLILLSCTVILFMSMFGGDDIEAMRAIEIPGEYLIKAKASADARQLDFIKLLVKLTSQTGLSSEGFDDAALEKALNAYDSSFDSLESTLYDIYLKSYSTLKVSPIPLQTLYTVKVKNIENGEKVEITKARAWTYSHFDDFGADRSYGGERRHLGNDLMAELGTPIVSMTDGVVTKMGWDELGGWRLGITDSNGSYWYYAHMLSYAAEISEGQSINEGTVIGYVGSSGYGSEGTTGQFEDHLHLQIGIIINEGDSEFTWINPYPIVVFMEANRITIDESR